MVVRPRLRVYRLFMIPLLVWLASSHPVSAEPASLSEAISTLAGSLQQRYLSALPSNSRIAVWPLRSRHTSAAILARGLLASALQQRASHLHVDIQEAEALASRFQPAVWDTRALKQVQGVLQCERLLTGVLLVRSERSYLEMTLWEPRVGHALEVFEIVFWTPPTWMEAPVSTTPPYVPLWRSHPLAGGPFLTLAVGDFDGDGANEMALISKDVVQWRRWNGWDMVTTDAPPRIYRDGVSYSSHYERDVRTAFVISTRERDELLLSVAPNLSGSDSEDSFTQRGMVVAVTGDQIWRSVFLPHKLAFSANETTRQISPGKVERFPLSEDYRLLRVVNVDDTPERELILVTPQGALKVSRIEEGRSKLWWQGPPNFGSALAVGDLDGNGLAEIVGSGRETDFQDDVWILEWDGRVFSTRAHWSLRGTIQDLTIGDVNQDDIPELLVLLNRSQDSLVLFYQAAPGNTLPPYPQATSTKP